MKCISIEISHQFIMKDHLIPTPSHIFPKQIQKLHNISKIDSFSILYRSNKEMLIQSLPGKNCLKNWIKFIIFNDVIYKYFN